jgi:DHA1 family bicyclomycin/chloramphenicol resistance-like MFS transporter
MLLSTSKEAAPTAAQFPLTITEFITLIALLMAVTALSIDIMLPALPQIGRSLGVQNENDRQLVISFYVVGFASGQLLFGILSDRFGRRAPLLTGLALYICGTTLALLSGSFHALLAARVLQGFSAAAPRVISVAIVRDRFEGREMARIMSFIMMVFFTVPILAPSVGETVLLVANWRAIFFLLLFAATVAALWSSLRLPETRQPQDRLPLSAHAILTGLKTILSNRQSAGYILATGFVFGFLMSYIVSAEQIFVDIYGLGSRFPMAFGAIASMMIASAVVNASVVRSIGMRVVSHRALIGLLLTCAAAALAGYPEKPPLIVFCLFMAVVFFCFGLIMPNFNALAMEPMGHLAGMASSIAGFYSTAAAAVFGTIVGRSFDGSVRPLMIGITVLALATLCTVLIVERGRLARPSQHPACAGNQQ